MARKPTLSPSKISTFLACPVKFRWTYIDSRGRWYLRAKSYYSFGATLHAVLERFHDSEDMGVTTTEQALAALDESWIEAGFSSAEEMAEAHGEGKIIIERHVEESFKRPLSSKTLFVERQLRLEFDQFMLVGRLDRVDEHEDGTLEIIDYKTGRMTVTPEDVRHDLALGCYQLLLHSRYPDRPINSTIVALRSGESATATLSSDELQELKRDLEKLGELVLSEEYHELTPRFKELCRSGHGCCDFLTLCRRHEDFGDPDFQAPEPSSFQSS